MKDKPPLTLITVLLCVSNTSTLFLIDYRSAVGSQLLLYMPLMLFGYAVIFFLYRGRNWARVLVVVGAVLGVLGLGLLIVQEDPVRRMLLGYDGALSVILIWYLNRREVRERFRAGRRSGSGGRGVSKGLVIALSVVGALAVLVGAAGFWVYRFVQKAGSPVIWVEDLESGDARPLLVEGVAVSPRYSPDGNLLLYQQSGELKVLTLSDGTIRTVVEHGRGISSPSWGPGGDRIYYRAEREGRVDLWAVDLYTGAAMRITDDEAMEDAPQLSPDGKWLVFVQNPGPGDGSARGDLYLMAADGGPKIRLTEARNLLHAPQDPAWSPDSKEIVFISFISLVVMNLQAEVVQDMKLVGLSNVSTPQFHPLDSDLIIFKARSTADLRSGFGLYAVSQASGGIAILRESGLAEMYHHISPDGRSIAYSAPLQ
jgi:Tol biopolymer transport system component